MLEVEAFGNKLQFEGNIAEHKKVKLQNGTVGDVYIMDSYFVNQSQEDIEEIKNNYSMVAKRACGLD